MAYDNYGFLQIQRGGLLIMKTWKIYYFEDGIMKNQIINNAKDKEDAIRIAREKYNIVALRCEEV